MLKIKITEKSSEKSKTEIINELIELKTILEQYKNKTIELKWEVIKNKK